MREAYNLLRQSIIHVEQDDIDFDEEELEGERDRDRDQRERGRGQMPAEDVEMNGPETDHMEESFNESGAGAPTSPTRAGGSGAQLAATPAPEEGEDAAAAPAPAKRKMKITHDRYVQIRSLVVYHIQKSEAEQSRGIDRDELVDWYLESREEDLHSVEELEYEKELFTKVLRKLVKVTSGYLLF